MKRASLPKPTDGGLKSAYKGEREGEQKMEATEFLKLRLGQVQSSFEKMGINANEIVRDLVGKGWDEHDATISVEYIKRDLKAKRDFLQELLAEAEEVAKKASR